MPAPIIMPKRTNPFQQMMQGYVQQVAQMKMEEMMQPDDVKIDTETSPEFAIIQPMRKGKPYGSPKIMNRPKTEGSFDINKELFNRNYMKIGDKLYKLNGNNITPVGEPDKTIVNDTIYKIDDPSQTQNIAYEKEKGYKPPDGWTLKTPSTTTAGMWDTLTPSQKKPYIESYLLTGKYDPEYYRDQTSRTLFKADYSDYLDQKGLNASDVQRIRSSNKALSQSLSQQEKNYGLMVSFVENLNKQVDRVDDLYTKTVKRLGTRAADLPIRKLKTELKGSGRERALEAYLLEISNEVGKLSTGSQASIRELSTDAQERWAKIHDPNLSLKEMKNVLEETKLMAQFRQKSTEDSIAFTNKRIENLLDNEEEPDVTNNDPLGIRQ